MTIPTSRFLPPKNAALLAALLTLSASGSALAEARPSFPFLLEAHEKEEDAPAYVWRTESSPQMVSTHGSFTSYQVNTFNGQNVLNDAANEPSITFDPTNPNRMSIGWRQFYSVQSNARRGGWAFTLNGGTNWTFQGSLDNTFRSDPVLASDRTGTFFYLSLVTNFYDDMWRSVNGGQSWVRLGPALGGDKQWFTIDTTTGSGSGFQYQVWSASPAGNNFEGRQFTRSTNGGLTWMDPIYIPNGPSFGVLDFDSAGRVFIAGFNLKDGQVWCVRSSDAKNAAVIPTFDQSTVVNLGGYIGFQEPINPVGILGQVNIATDRSGTSTNDNIYVLASVIPDSGNSRSDVMFARSTDGGQTFSTPKRINDDPAHPDKWHWLAAMSVAPNGRIDVVWLDTRNAANHTDSQLFYSYSFDGGITWSANVEVSASFNPLIGYPNQAKMGDYIQVVSDNSAGHVAYTATFTGGQDVYYVRVAPHVPTPLAVVSRKTHGASGTFDVPLRLTGNVAVESRTGSGPSFDAHRVVVTFPKAVTVGGVTVSSANGLATATQTTVGAEVTVDLANVADQQTLTITLTDVNDGLGTGNVVIPMAILVGDTNASRTVNASDLGEVKARSGQAVSSTNFRMDVTASGGAINAGDIGLVKSKSGGALPP